MTAATRDRPCAQHHCMRSQCRPTDRHVITGRASDELMAKVQAVAEAVGMSKNDALEMALEALVRTPLERIAEQALRDRRTNRPAPVRFVEPAPDDCAD
jgi:predicted transcriptional regulator